MIYTPTFVILLAACCYSAPAFALSCDELALLLEAGTPVSIVTGTVRVSSPLPTLSDLMCLRSKGVSAGIVNEIADAAGLDWAEVSPGLANTLAPAPLPPPPAETSTPTVRVRGMDAEHTAGAVAAASDFATNIAIYRHGVCPALE